MRFTIDTELERIIVPDSYYRQIDKMNELLKTRGADGTKQIDYIENVKEAYEKAISNPLVRKSDVAKLKNQK